MSHVFGPLIAAKFSLFKKFSNIIGHTHYLIKLDNRKIMNSIRNLHHQSYQTHSLERPL